MQKRKMVHSEKQTSKKVKTEDVEDTDEDVYEVNKIVGVRYVRAL